MPKTLLFSIDGYQVMATTKSLALPDDTDIIGCFFDSQGYVRNILRKSIYGELLLNAASEQANVAVPA